MSKTKLIKTIITFIFFLTITNAFAQPMQAPEDDDAATDALEPAPIADFILPMLMLGVATAYVLLRKKVKSQVI